MKKLMITAAAVALCTSLHAYTYDWKVGSSAIYAGDASTLVGEDTKVYLFNALSYSQQDLLNDLIINNKTVDYVSSKNAGMLKTNSDSIANTYSDKLDHSNFGSLSGDNKFNYYFAIFGDGKVYLSKTAQKGADLSDSTSNTSLSFSSYGSSTQTTFDAERSKSATAFADNGKGWYTTAVPEPTSGLLLLLGVAGLALRRRRV